MNKDSKYEHFFLLAPRSLPVHECFAAIAVIFALLAISIFSLHSAQKKQHLGAPHYIVDQFIEVKIEGEVEFPGTFRVKRGTCVQDVIEQAKPLLEANMSRLKLTSKVRHGQTIKVKKGKKRKNKPNNEA